MIEALEARGCHVLHVPVLEVAPPEDPGPLDRAAASLPDYDWIAFTSANGVRALAGRLPGGAPPTSRGATAAPRIAAVGPATAKAVREHLGGPPDLVPEETWSAEGLVDAFRAGAPSLEGARALLPLAEGASDVLETGLWELGVRVERVSAYRTVAPEGRRVDAVREALGRGEVDLLTFTSPSSAENFLELVGEAALGAPVAAIGPVTGGAAGDLGYRVVAVPAAHTVNGLVEAVAAYLEGVRSSGPGATDSEERA